MDQENHLLLLKGEDKTRDVEFCEYVQGEGIYRVTFGGSKVYTYGYQAVEWLRNPRKLEPADYEISRNGKRFGPVESISEFSGSDVFWHLTFPSGVERTYRKQDLSIRASCLAVKDARNKLEYLGKLAEAGELKDEEGESLLGKYFQKLRFVGDDTVLATYLDPESNPVQTRGQAPLIFPFGGNASQFQAVQQAMEHSLSVIQGPPGTGKTQTILNIIANLLVRGQTVQVVSNNNSATENVLEKLQNSLDFLVAELGRKEHKLQFLERQTGRYPNLSRWRLEPEKLETLQAAIGTLSRELSQSFARQERLAQARAEQKALELESDYFKAYCQEKNLEKPQKQPSKRLKAEKILKLIQYCEFSSEAGEKLPLWFKLQATALYGAFEWRYLQQDSGTLITYLQWLYYVTRNRELVEEIKKLEDELTGFQAEKKMAEMTSMSMAYLRGKIYERFGGKVGRRVFSEDVFWKNPQDLLTEYPITLSTTFSAFSSLSHVTYDYVIMDEASQVDLVTGSLAMACAKNAVIVGDLKQLPNVVTRQMQEQTEAIRQAYRIPEGYVFADNSFLKSVCAVIPEVPQTLLREHYRCRPPIIEFCNQKFYQNQLMIMTDDHEERDTLAVYRTPAGNHHRGHVNQRQIDVTLQEVLPTLASIPGEEIGIIAPYRDQVETIAAAIPNKKIEVDTVHKFQGREKRAIVLMTVDDRVTDFSDDPYLLNVAISRARERLCLVTSGNEQPADSNIQDLIAYIRYHNFQIIDSNLYSIFDLLYEQYTQKRVEYLSKHRKISEFDSENIMYGQLSDLLRQMPELTLRVICHQPLRLLIRNPELLTREERRYAFHPNTHVDFMIYNQISKAPVLAIEVDGVRYHRPGTAQAQRDQMKDCILRKYGIRLLRLPTNGSGEMEKVRKILTEKNSTDL